MRPRHHTKSYFLLKAETSSFSFSVLVSKRSLAISFSTGKTRSALICLTNENNAVGSFLFISDLRLSLLVLFYFISFRSLSFGSGWHQMLRNRWLTRETEVTSLPTTLPGFSQSVHRSFALTFDKTDEIIIVCGFWHDSHNWVTVFDLCTRLSL